MRQRTNDPASSFLCQLQEPPLAPRPPKPVVVPRGRRPPQEPGGREEAEAGGAAPGMNKPRLRLGSQQDQEESEVQGLPPGWRGPQDASGTLLPTPGPHPKHPAVSPTRMLDLP